MNYNTRSRASASISLEGEPSSTNPERQTTLADILDALHELRKENRALHDRIRALEDNGSANHSVTPSESDNEPSPVPSPITTVQRDPKVASPDPFSGKVSEFQNFIAQCTLTLTICPNTYPTDEKRVLFVISHLKGGPLTWARDIIFDNKHPLRNDYTAFKTALTDIYGDRAYKTECEDRILTLTQTGSASLYAQKFQALAAPLELDDKAKCFMFYRGLNSEVKRAIITAGRAAFFQALVDQAVNFDQLFFQQLRQEKRDFKDESTLPTKRRRTSGTTENDYPTMPSTKPPLARTSPPRSPPRFIASRPRSPLTDMQKEYRRQNKLCLYCADPNHIVANCHRAPKTHTPFVKPNANKISVSNLNCPRTPTLAYPVPIRPATAPPGPENWTSQHLRA